MSGRKAKAKPHGKSRGASSSVPGAPKPGASVGAGSNPPIPPAPPPQPAPDPAVVRAPRKFGRPKDVRDMDRAELEAYAMELGMLKRCLTLTDDRLRQNIRAFIEEMFE